MNIKEHIKIICAKVKSLCQIDIDEAEAFRILCQTLNASFVLDEDVDMFAKEDEFGENGIYFLENRKEQKLDDRGDLFVALRNVVVNMFTNLSFRNANYIYNK